jgi:hypothetical protein
METEEVIKKREAIEIGGNGIPELEKPKQEPKKPRYVRRLEKTKKEYLDALVLEFFTERSALEELDGELAAKIFDIKEMAWRQHCLKFNARKEPIKLRYEAFAEAVEFYAKMEKDQMAKNAEANKAKDFAHWFRRSNVYRTRPLTAFSIEVISLFNREKVLHHWKNYYINNVIDATN